jgi:hypothetical protein
MSNRFCRPARRHPRVSARRAPAAAGGQVGTALGGAVDLAHVDAALRLLGYLLEDGLQVLAVLAPLRARVWSREHTVSGQAARTGA